MNNPHSLTRPEFASPEEAEEWDRRFRQQIQESLEDSSPTFPQEEVMAEMRALLEAKLKASGPTTEEAEAYDRWFRAKIQADLDDSSPTVPHEQVMEEMSALLADTLKKRAESGKKS